MLTFFESSYRPCDGVTRRDFFRVGALGFGGLTLANLLNARAHGAADERAKPKSVIMVYLPGGPSHIDMYDLKPDAPVEIRGEFKPIQTNVPGLDICELMPLQAKIADKFSIVRGLQCVDTHSAELLMRGHLGGPQRRPVFGSIVSKLRGGCGDSGMPHYVALGGENGADPGDPAYLGSAYKPFTGGQGLNNLSLVKGVTPAQLTDRKQLLKAFDTLSRELDTRAGGDLSGMETFNARALEIISSPKVRDAFDVNKEPQSVRDKYGKNGTRLLQARRLVEAGASVVTLSAAGTMYHGGDWDTHAGTDQRSETNFQNLRGKLPEYDRTLHALVTDIYERGLDQDVCLVVWGEFGRTPKINKNGGRDHWAPATNAFIAGGGLKMGQVVGDTGPRAERAKGTVYTPANVLATLYRLLGIDPATTVPDLTGRPMYLLDDREPIAELM
jgi:hypothetical protein